MKLSDWHWDLRWLPLTMAYGDHVTGRALRCLIFTINAVSPSLWKKLIRHSGDVPVVGKSDDVIMGGHAPLAQ